MKIAAEADLLDLDFVRSENLSRSAQRIVLGVVKAAHEVSIKSDFRREEFRIPYQVFIARCAVQPGPVGIGERFCRRWLFR